MGLGYCLNSPVQLLCHLAEPAVLVDSGHEFPRKGGVLVALFSLNGVSPSLRIQLLEDISANPYGPSRKIATSLEQTKRKLEVYMIS